MSRQNLTALLTSVSILALTFVASSQSKPSVPQGRQGDERVITEIITRWDEGWKNFDAELASRDYAADADWTNAFGHGARGKTAIFDYLAKIYQSPQMRSRKSTPSQTSLRFVGPDVAVASSYRETVGQKTASGAEYPTRKTHDLRVFARSKGRWSIVSHLIMDEKETKP
ncbi:MAG: nuclear transport factor 2 family protein [Myxococcales bacterium]